MTIFPFDAIEWTDCAESLRFEDRNRTLAPLSTTVVDSQRRTTNDENIWIAEGLLLRKDRSLGHAAKSLMVRTQ
jgi:hypothetical protein